MISSGDFLPAMTLPRLKGCSRPDPRVEPEQGGKIAHLVSSIGVAGNRQPFLPSAPGGSLAHFPLALGAVLMVLCPALPRVIGKFVIVPAADHGQQLVSPPEIGIYALGATAQANNGSASGTES